MDAADHEDNDLHPDFRVLLNNSKGQSSQALPNRDAKSSQGPDAALNDQYDAFFQILGEDRRAAEKTYSRAVYEPNFGLFRITLNKGTHFVSLGHTIQGQIYLFPEEALYLVDRGSLLVEHLGCDISVQQMWNIYLTIPIHYPNQAEENDREGSMVMDRYLVYAYLKRLGFTVIRPGIYSNESGSHKHSPASTQKQLTSPSNGYISFVWSILRRTLTALWSNNCYPLIHKIGLGLISLKNIWSAPSNRPLVSHDECSDYNQILQSIQIIEDMRLAPSNGVKNSNSSVENKSPSRKILSIDFDVYKPSSPFKKRQPGNPDYHVVVSKSNKRLPTVSELENLMKGQLDPVLETTSASQVEKGKKKKSIEWPKVLFGIVDGGQVSFIALSNIKAIP